MKDTSLFFPTSHTPDDASDDGYCIDFGKVGNHQIQAFISGPEYKTQLMIEDESDGDFDSILLDITHLRSLPSSLATCAERSTRARGMTGR